MQFAVERLLQLRSEARSLEWWRFSRRAEIRGEVDAALDTLARFADPDDYVDTFDGEEEGPW